MGRFFSNQTNFKPEISCRKINIIGKEMKRNRNAGVKLLSAIKIRAIHWLRTCVSERVAARTGGSQVYSILAAESCWASN